jgi:hypothetical protein
MTTMINNSDLENAANAFPHGWKMTIVSGDSASTDIPVTGITTNDKLMAVIEIAATSADRTSTSSITADDVIQSTDDTSSGVLVVFWWDKED